MFRYYVANDHFTIETDHESLKWLMKLEKPPRLVRWAIDLSKYNFTIVPKAGKLNNTADALSRLPKWLNFLKNGLFGVTWRVILRNGSARASNA